MKYDMLDLVSPVKETRNTVYGLAYGGVDLI